MKNNRLLSAFLVGAVALLIAVDASAQEQSASLNERGDAQPITAERPSVQLLEARKAELSSLQKRKAALRTYLENTEPDSSDYKAAQRTLIDLEVKLQDAAGDVVRLAKTARVEPPAAIPMRTLTSGAAAPARRMLVAATDAPAPVAAPSAAPVPRRVDSLSATLLSTGEDTAKITIDIVNYFGQEIIVQAKDVTGKVVDSPEGYEVLSAYRRTNSFVVEVRLADAGDTTVIVSSSDGSITTTLTVPQPPPAATHVVAATPTGGGKRGGAVGYTVGGIVVSQQAQNFNQADPFFGFIAGYDSDRHGAPKGFGAWRWHLRFQGIFTASGRTAEAEPAANGNTGGEGGGNTGGGDTSAQDPFKFIASRKSFDVDTHAWIDFWSNNAFSIGPYVAWGASATMDKNELDGEPVIADAGNDESTVATQSVSDNDLKQFKEAGMIMNLKMGSDAKPKLFLQAILAKGWYEAMKDLDGTDDDTRNRFIGKLRVFPEGLSFGLGNKVATPMFGVELNAGAGPDQIKFFTGVAIRIKGFSFTGK